MPAGILGLAAPRADLAAPLHQDVRLFDERRRLGGRRPADLGLAPTRRDPFTDVSLSTKIFEYVAMGKPVVASRLPLVEQTFPAGTIWTYEPGDTRSLATAIEAIADQAAAREAAVAAAFLAGGARLAPPLRARHRPGAARG